MEFLRPGCALLPLGTSARILILSPYRPPNHAAYPSGTRSEERFPVLLGSRRKQIRHGVKRQVQISDLCDCLIS